MDILLEYDATANANQTSDLRNGNKIVHALEKLDEISKFDQKAKNVKHLKLYNFDLQELTIKDLDISYCNFAHCDLKGATFEHVTIFRTNFSSCDLRKSNLTKERLKQESALYNEATLFE